MRFMKKVVAFTMAVMLLIPSVAVNAEEPQVLGVQAAEQLGQEPTAADANTGTDEKKDNETPAVGDTADENAAQPEEKQGNASEEGKDAPEAEAQEEEKLPEEEQVQKEEEALPKNGASEEGKPQDIENVQFNTGDYVWTIVNEDDFNTYEYGDGYFEEDGSYTINIPELNPFFPYEVQFTSNGKTENKWFQSPDDTVEVGGHIFKVAANFDGTGITQMSMEVAGDTVVVYPEEKTFTNDGDGVQEMSLLPLEKKNLSVDLQGYTPVELTKVKVKTIVESLNLSDDVKIAWKNRLYDEYSLKNLEDEVDLSYCAFSSGNECEMIVGDGDQLNSDNIRYKLNVLTTKSSQWLGATVYAEDTNHVRKEKNIQKITNSASFSSYWYYSKGNVQYAKNYLSIDLAVENDEENYVSDIFLSLTLNKGDYNKTKIDHVKIVSGGIPEQSYIEDILKNDPKSDITSQIMGVDMSQSMAGYKSGYSGSDICMVAYDADGKIIGILPIYYSIRTPGIKTFDVEGYLPNASLSDKSVAYGQWYGERTLWLTLDKEYPLDTKLSVVLQSDHFTATAVYVGNYNTIAAAKKDGAEEITNKIWGKWQDNIGGYSADFSKGVWISVFKGTDEDSDRKVYNFLLLARHSGQSSSSMITFTGLKNADGKDMPSYVINKSDDSYGENNYVTILVDENTDLSKQYAPVFSNSSYANVYTGGGTSKEESGKTLHSFANGPIQYTVYAEDEQHSKNYWVQVKKADSSLGQLYISSLADKDANTHVENGVTYSTREVMLDGYHNYYHDICLVNIGKEALPNLSVELTSDVVELDDYWNLTGNQPLSGMLTVETPSWSSGKEGKLPNLAKLRLKAKNGVRNGTDVSGTLTIKSGNKVLMVLTLTGVVGDPCITTETIPDAVKYVPYGTPIQNSNKYSWIQVAYEVYAGELPEGMVLKENGELYGTPQNAGTYNFTVRASFTSTKEAYSFRDSTASFTLTVKDNTNDNVYNESDIADGYILETSIGNETSAGSHDFYLPEITDSLFVSKGIYPNFVDLWLNGEKLVRGVDYDAASGSTRITISAQTLQNKALKTGVNTIAAEFRDGGAANFAKDNDPKNALKRTAQNFRLDKTDADGGNGGGGHSHGSSDDGDDAGSGAGKGVTISGYLVDGSGNPISGMTVELHSTPRTTVTAQNGFFRFTNVEFGQHELFAKDSDGNILASKKFELRSGKTVGFAGNVLSAPAGSAVVMTVKVADGNMTFSNVRRGNPQTGDHANTAMWLLLMAGSCAVLAGLAAYRKRRSAR